MRGLAFLAVQLVVCLAKLARPGGVRSVIAATLEMKRRNPRLGYHRIVEQIGHTFSADQ